MLYGPSGVGKTTLLNIIGTLLKPTEGKVKLFDKLLTDGNLYELRSQIGFIFQTPIFFENQTVIENIIFYANLNQLDIEEAKVHGARLLKEFNLEMFANQIPSLMSGGQRQRLAIIMPLIKKPKLILADEPLGSIDYMNKKIVLETLTKIAKETTLIIVSHDMKISEICTNTINLEEISK